MRHINLDAHQHPVCREPLRPASSGELQHNDRVGLVKTTFGTSTSTRILARSAASPLEQRAAPRLHTSGSTGPVNATSGTSTSTNFSTRAATSHFDQHATPALQPSDQTGSASTTCGTLTSTRNGGRLAATLRPASGARASAQRLHRAGEDSVQHINLGMHPRSAVREPPRSAGRTRTSAP